jgi:hypothetical protein
MDVGLHEDKGEREEETLRVSLVHQLNIKMNKYQMITSLVRKIQQGETRWRS